MLKKRLLIIGSLLALSIIGQVVLRPCLGEDKALSSACPAEPNSTTPAQSEWNLMKDSGPRSFAPSDGFVGKFITMIAVVAVIGLAGWVCVKKMNAPWTAGKNRHLTLIETMSLGPRRAVYLIQADGKKLLIGGGPEGLRLISDLGQSAAATMPEGNQ